MLVLILPGVLDILRMWLLLRCVLTWFVEVFALRCAYVIVCVFCLACVRCVCVIRLVCGSRCACLSFKTGSYISRIIYRKKLLSHSEAIFGYLGLQLGPKTRMRVLNMSITRSASSSLCLCLTRSSCVGLFMFAVLSYCCVFRVRFMFVHCCECFGICMRAVVRCFNC